MLIVGELINTSRKAISQAVQKRDAAYIQQIAREQVEAGADYVDVNCGTQVYDEVEVMEWLVNTIQEAVEAPLCIDSPSAKAIDAGLQLCKYGQPMVNSITGEKERFAEILPLILKHKAKIVALCMDDSGMPTTAEDRIKVADALYAGLTDAGVSADDIYFDPLVKPVSVSAKAGLEVLEAVRMITEKYPKAHKICGLSNISFGLPNRKILNRYFVVQTMVNGMDGYIFDPVDKAMMGAVYASQALLGQDDYCVEYLTAHRNELYE